MLKILSVSAAALFCANAATAATLTLDFNDLTRGDAISTVNVGGVTGAIATTGGGKFNAGEVIVFDTDNAGTNADGDPDLQATFFSDFVGTAPNGTPAAGATESNPGNVLVIGEAPDADSGADTNPDDNGRGGQIIFTFESDVAFEGFDVFDDVDDFIVRAFDGLGTQIFATTPLSLDFNNQFASVSGLGWTGVRELEFDFGRASGAIDNLAFEVAAVPVPASLPLLLAGFGAFGFVARRKKA